MTSRATLAHDKLDWTKLLLVWVGWTCLSVEPWSLPGTMILINFILNYVRKLSGKFDLFLLRSLWEGIKMTQLYIAICDYLPFEEDLDLYLNKISFSQGWFVPSLIGIGL
jgi:hypothetical protein